ncbi:uncharacterized protein [Hetaerina americana]|uniref:uncharacterized protein n=1 Tax=Hetaerina americana TaxID=62018 RepID=UPI003A7F3204
MFDFINEPFWSFELDLMEDGGVIEKLLIELTEQDRHLKMAEKDLEKYNENQLQKMIKCERVVLFTKTFDFESIECKKMFDFINEPFRSFELDLMEDGGVIEKLLIELTEQNRPPWIYANDTFVGNRKSIQTLYNRGYLHLFVEDYPKLPGESSDDD